MRVIGEFIFTILKSFLLVVTILVIFICSIFLNREYIENAIEESNYCEKLSNEIYEKLIMYVYQSGFDEQILENICNSDIIKDDTEILISNFFDSKDESLKYEEYIENTLTENMKKNEKVSEMNNDEINAFIKCIKDEYKNAININIISKKINYSKIKEIFKKLMIFPIVFVITEIFSFCILSKGNKKKKIKDLAYTLFISGFVGLSFVYIIKSNIDINNIMIFGQSFSGLLKFVSNDLITTYIYINIIELGAGIICSLLSNNKKPNEIMEE